MFSYWSASYLGNCRETSQLYKPRNAWQLCLILEPRYRQLKYPSTASEIESVKLFPKTSARNQESLIASESAPGRIDTRNSHTKSTCYTETHGHERGNTAQDTRLEETVRPESEISSVDMSSVSPAMTPSPSSTGETSNDADTPAQTEQEQTGVNGITQLLRAIGSWGAPR